MAISNALPTSGHLGRATSSPSIMLAVASTLSGNYAAGGYDFDAAAIVRSLGVYDQLPTVLAVLVEGAPNLGVVFTWNRTTKKLQAWYGDYSVSADGALVEYANGVALAAVVRVLIVAQ